MINSFWAQLIDGMLLLSGMVGFQISPSFLVGLAYDREITELGQAIFNDGSFEVILRYDFIKSKTTLKSPRFF